MSMRALIFRAIDRQERRLDDPIVTRKLGYAKSRSLVDVWV